VPLLVVGDNAKNALAGSDTHPTLIATAADAAAPLSVRLLIFSK